MAEVKIRREILIDAETIGDVARWLRTVEDQPTSTELVEPVTLAVTVSEPVMRPRGEEEERRR